MKTYTFHVFGATCASCQMFIEDVLNKQSNVRNACVNLSKGIVTLEAEEMDVHALAKMLTEKMEGKRYVISVEKIVEDTKNDVAVFWQALPLGLFFLALFFVLQKSGLLNFGIGGKTTPTTSFLIGLVASVSSCLAVVGGLVLSLSAKIAEDGNMSKKPLYLFHIGRLISFALLGGVLGLIGERIGINYIFSAILGLTASLVMIILGLNLVGIFKNGKFILPKGIFAFFRKGENYAFAPLLLGVGTFFLPCGFTQSMQVAALSSGSFVTGLSLMLFFALGTLPVLSLLSFGSTAIAEGKYSVLFFKTVGIVVIGLGMFSLLAGLAGLGIITPLFSM